MTAESKRGGYSFSDTRPLLLSPVIDCRIFKRSKSESNSCFVILTLITVVSHIGDATMAPWRTSSMVLQPAASFVYGVLSLERTPGASFDRLFGRRIKSPMEKLCGPLVISVVGRDLWFLADEISGTCRA